MNPRYKMLGIHVILFFSVFLLSRYIMTLLLVAPNALITLIPIGLSWILAPRPHVVQMQSGKKYGLKWYFSSKIIKVQ
jgi:hypothetical protein